MTAPPPLRRARRLSDHQADTVLANPDLGWTAGTMEEARAIRATRQQRPARPSSDRVIEARRAPQRSPEAAEYTPFWAIVGVVCLIALAVALVTADGIARAFERPDACLTLSAQECAAKLQEKAVK